MKYFIAITSFLLTIHTHAAMVPFGNVNTVAEGHYQLISTNGKADKKLEKKLDLPKGTLDNVSGFNVKQGSIIYDELTINTGDTLSFDWLWDTNEVFEEPEHRDFAFASLSMDGITIIADTFSPILTTGTFSWTATTTGLLTFGVGVVNVKDKNVASYLEVSNIIVSEVPIPGSVILLLTSLVGTRLLRKQPI